MKRRNFFTAALGLLAAPLSLFRKKPEEKWGVRWFRSVGGPIKGLQEDEGGGQGCIKGQMFGIDYWCGCLDCETERASDLLSYLGRVSGGNVKPSRRN